MHSLVFWKTFFGVELSFFLQSPKVILLIDCAFPLTLLSLGYFCPQQINPYISPSVHS